MLSFADRLRPPLERGRNDPPNRGRRRIIPERPEKRVFQGTDGAGAHYMFLSRIGNPSFYQYPLQAGVFFSWAARSDWSDWSDCPRAASSLPLCFPFLLSLFAFPCVSSLLLCFAFTGHGLNLHDRSFPAAFLLCLVLLSSPGGMRVFCSFFVFFPGRTSPGTLWSGGRRTGVD